MNDNSVMTGTNIDSTVRIGSKVLPYGLKRRERFSGIIPAMYLLLIVVGSWFIKVWFDGGLFSTVWLLSAVSVYLVISIGGRPMLARIECNFLLYSMFLGCLLSVLAIWASDPVYSAPRAIITSLALGLAAVFGVRFTVYMLTAPKAFFSTVHFGLSAFFVFFIFGYLVLPEFSSGPAGLRLSGGVNPNTAGMYCLYVIIWVMLVRAITGANSLSANLLLALTFTVLTLSFSRASWLATCLLFLLILLFSKKSKVLKDAAKWVLLISSIGVAYLAVYGVTGDLYEYLSYFDARIFGAIGSDSNALSRIAAWDLLLYDFYDSPVVGHFGWYNSTNFLNSSVIAESASSPHSLHVRLLAEVGLLGYIAIVGLPIAAIFSGLNSLLFAKKTRGQLKRRRIYAVLVSGLVGIFFGREVFEDTYLVSYLGLTTLVVTFLIAFLFTLRGSSSSQV